MVEYANTLKATYQTDPSDLNKLNLQQFVDSLVGLRRYAQAEGLDRPTYPGELGKRIFESVSKEAWQQWMKQQTMLINEYRLNPLDPKARKMIEEQMEQFFDERLEETLNCVTAYSLFDSGPFMYSIAPALN